MYKSKLKRYNDVERAKNILDSSLEKYVKNAKAQDIQYLNEIVSRNASIKFREGSVNEIVADVAVLGDELGDKVLLDLVSEVLRNGRRVRNNGSSK
ncbi:hypothetical protein HCG60_03295 [Ligilactobacillus murinus]|uniref:hypothetical protein n=1 Tax=Ligilactobacillus murinus TaxID=1622 RepID=UPI00143412C5|nr:hypothetical protein [Ligilactobacillus murinus]MBX9012061.1 hypothetical protein [Ligilactobacillus murinus]GFI62671.1 hypothetical protein IMSAG117_00075 [Lactobacillaceae bacterium]